MLSLLYWSLLSGTVTFSFKMSKFLLLLLATKDTTRCAIHEYVNMLRQHEIRKNTLIRWDPPNVWYNLAYYKQT